MPRAKVDIIVRRNSGLVVPSASVYLYELGTTTPIDLFTTRDGGTDKPQPILTNSRGEVATAYGEPGSYSRRIVYPGADYTTEYELVSASDLGGRVIEEATITSTFTTSSTHTTLQDVTGLAVTITATPQPIIVQFLAASAAHSTTGGWTAAILEGATALAAQFGRVGTAGYGEPVNFETPSFVPTVGNHTYKVQFSAANVNAAASLTAGATFPAILRVKGA